MKSKIVIMSGLIIILATFFRIYRTSDFLGFWFDQGRDAQVIWDLIHHHVFFLIGPTTGIEGIFRGPWYYWLITPAYFLGQGNPVWPAVFLAFTTVLAVALCARLAYLLGGKQAGVLALFISGLSYEFVQSARWLSNPTPMFLISMLIVYCGLQIIEGKKNFWIVLGFLLGIAMQFGSATEIFFYPAFGLLVLLKKNTRPSLKIIFFSIAASIAPFLPTIAFDIRHQFILTKNIFKFFVADQSFKLSFIDNLKIRLPFYLKLLGTKISPSYSLFAKVFIFLGLFSAFKNRKNLPSQIKFILLLCFMPLLGMLFFQGNHGNVYDYYFTGFHFIFVLAFAILIPKISTPKISLIVISAFLALFLQDNIQYLVRYLYSPPGPYVALTTEIEAVDWIYADAKGQEFNVDFYVPPMIPYSYYYLFTWRGTNIHHQLPKVERIKSLYTIQEPDPGQQTLQNTWRARQAGLSSVEYNHTIGSLLIEKRYRHE